MKNIISTMFMLLITLSISSQPLSPYVETTTSIINNTGFKSSSLRSGTLTRPVTFHLSTSPINSTVAGRFRVAISDVMPTTWAGASGFTAASNNSATNIVASPATGCNSYSETGRPAGTWRVPTQREMMIIHMMRLELKAATIAFQALISDNTTRYWSSSSASNSYGWSVSIANGIVYSRAKTESYRVRCVYDL